MPSDLCDYHRQVVRQLAEKDHVSDRESIRAADQIARQCLDCGGDDA